jgi:hypothetical protein
MSTDFGNMWNRKQVIRDQTDVLVLDEVSMLSGEMLDCVEKEVTLTRTIHHCLIVVVCHRSVRSETRIPICKASSAARTVCL